MAPEALQAHIVRLATSLNPKTIKPIQTEVGQIVPVGDKDPSFRALRESMQVTVPDRKTERPRSVNYVDYIKEDPQIEEMLDLGLKLSIITEKQLQELGINFQKAQVAPGPEGVRYTVGTQSKLQKADVMVLVWDSLRNSKDFQRALLKKLTQNVQKVSHERDHKGNPIAARPITDVDMANAIMVAGNELLADYLKDLSYAKHDFAPGTQDPTRRQLASDVIPTGGTPDEQRIVRPETKTQNIFTKSPRLAELDAKPWDQLTVAEKQEWVELSRQMEKISAMDMIIGQAMFDTYIPTDIAFKLNELQLKMEAETDVVNKSQLSHDITNLRQDIYAAILMAKHVEGFDQKAVGSMARYDHVKEIADQITTAYDKVPLHDANVASLAHIFASNLHLNERTVYNVFNKFDMSRQRFVTREDKLVIDGGLPRDLAPTQIYDEWFKELMRELPKSKRDDISPRDRDHQREVLKRIFTQRVNTEKRLHERLGKSDAALYSLDVVRTNIQGLEGRGLKAIELMWRRTKSPEIANPDQALLKAEEVIEEGRKLEQTHPGDVHVLEEKERAAKAAENKDLQQQFAKLQAEAVAAEEAAKAAEAAAAGDISKLDAAVEARNKANTAAKAASEMASKVTYSTEDVLAAGSAVIDEANKVQAVVEQAETASRAVKEAEARRDEAARIAVEADARLKAAEAKAVETKEAVEKERGIGLLRQAIQTARRLNPLDPTARQALKKAEDEAKQAAASAAAGAGLSEEVGQKKADAEAAANEVAKLQGEAAKKSEAAKAATAAGTV